MTETNVAIVRDALAAFERGDERALLGHLSPQVVWHPTGFLTGEREFVGTDAVERWLAAVRELRTRDGKLVRTEANEFRDLGNAVLVLGRGELIRPGGGRINQELGWIWRLEDGKVVAMTNYLGHAEALKAAGLSE